MILCPSCRHRETKVIDSRAGATSDEIRRRRECLDCATRFTTYERIRLNVQRGPLLYRRATLLKHKAAIDAVLDSLIEECPIMIDKSSA